MMNRRRLKCDTCGATTVARTAVGHGPYQEFAFPCPGCGAEIRFGMDLDQANVSIKYTKIANASWVKGEDKDDYVEFFDGENLVPIDKTLPVSPFIAVMSMVSDNRKFVEHQEIRRHISINLWPIVERMQIHLKSSNWTLFQRDSKKLGYKCEVAGAEDALSLMQDVLERCAVVFRPTTSAHEARVRQRINLAETMSETLCLNLVQHFSASGAAQDLWLELESIRKRWHLLYPCLAGVYTRYYWHHAVDHLDEFTLAQKRFDDLKPFYVDCFETFCRISVVAGGLEGIIHFKQLGVPSAHRLMSLQEFDATKNGVKPDILKNLVIGDIFTPYIDSKLRNGVGHHAARYDVKSDSVEYVTKDSKGLIARHGMSYARFCEKVVILYAQLETTAFYVNWLKGRALGISGKKGRVTCNGFNMGT